MLSQAENKLAAKIIFWTVLAVSLFILPQYSIDPVNSPKLFVLGIGGFCSAFLVSIFISRNTNFLKTPHLITGMLLLGISTISMIFGGRLEDQFFGVFGRNTGFLSIFSLLFIFILSCLVRGNELIERLGTALLISGTLALLYGLLQSLDIDPVSYEKSGYTNIYGFLGNPNFQSAFLGMFGSYLSSFILSRYLDPKIRVLAVVGFILGLYVIQVSESEQGFFVLIVGIFSNLIFWSLRHKNKSILIILNLFLGLFSTFLIAGLLNRGPLANYLYQDSIQFRGDYWRAAWKMANSSPFIGIGIDRYGENYRLFRDLEATVRRGPDVVSNSAHNVFLEYLSNSGFFALGFYIFLHILTIFAIFKNIRQIDTLSTKYVGLVGVWFGYVAQSVISVNQLGLSIWNFALMGALIGTSVSLIKSDLSALNDKRVPSSRIGKGALVQKHLSFGIFLAFCFGGLISILPLYRDVEITLTLRNSQEVVEIENLAYKRPLQSQMMFYIIKTLSENNFNSESSRVAHRSVDTFPNTYELWKIFAALPGASQAEIERAKIRMKELDPYNPEFN